MELLASFRNMMSGLGTLHVLVSRRNQSDSVIVAVPFGRHTRGTRNAARELPLCRVKASIGRVSRATGPVWVTNQRH